jgi:hypothetical protein
MAHAAALADRRVSDRVLVPRSRAIEFGMDVAAYAGEIASAADQAVDAIFSGNRMRGIDRLARIGALCDRLGSEGRVWAAACEAAR